PLASSSGYSVWLGFQAAPTDPSTSQVDMGTRWYEAGLGRFDSRDTLFGDPAAPGSLNQYAYGEANPVTMVDPTGMRPHCQGCTIKEEVDAAAAVGRAQTEHALQNGGSPQAPDAPTVPLPEVKIPLWESPPQSGYAGYWEYIAESRAEYVGATASGYPAAIELNKNGGLDAVEAEIASYFGARACRYCSQAGYLFGLNSRNGGFVGGGIKLGNEDVNFSYRVKVGPSTKLAGGLHTEYEWEIASDSLGAGNAIEGTTSIDYRMRPNPVGPVLVAVAVGVGVGALWAVRHLDYAGSCLESGVGCDLAVDPYA
ncbi:MAG: hypothetical protein HY240_01575, partial [Actinobacteria bacterium]|nr:hypothetical protein [Actinomycetota bacterium]